MKDTSKPAFPIRSFIGEDIHKGLSKHQLISAMCLQGVLANPALYSMNNPSAMAYEYATALLKLYEEEKKI